MSKKFKHLFNHLYRFYTKPHALFCNTVHFLKRKNKTPTQFNKANSYRTPVAKVPVQQFYVTKESDQVTNV